MTLTTVLWAITLVVAVAGFILCAAVSGGCFDPHASRTKRFATVIFLAALAALCFCSGLGLLGHIGVTP